MPTSTNYEDRLKGLLWKNARHKYCIHVDAASMQSVLDSPTSAEPNLPGVDSVNLIRGDHAWEAWEKESGQFSATHQQDEGEPDIEGRTSRNVGRMRVAVDGLIPEVCETLVNDRMWDNSHI
jgi:hypothetical protein